MFRRTTLFPKVLATKRSERRERTPAAVSSLLSDSVTVTILRYFWRLSPVSSAACYSCVLSIPEAFALPFSAPVSLLMTVYFNQILSSSLLTIRLERHARGKASLSFQWRG